MSSTIRLLQFKKVNKTMRIIKEPKLPKLRNAKYKCSKCDTIFDLTDKELLENITYRNMLTDCLNSVTIPCPFCGKNSYISSKFKQITRCKNYIKIAKAQKRLYGKCLGEVNIDDD